MEVDAAALRRTFRHAKAGGHWRISVRRTLWPDILIPTKRVYRKLKRWLNKEVGDVHTRRWRAQPAASPARSSCRRAST